MVLLDASFCKKFNLFFGASEPEEEDVESERSFGKV